MNKLLIVVATLSVSVCMAQTGKEISFEQAMDITLRDNPQMKTSLYEQSIAEQQMKATRGLRMPQIGVTGTYAYLGQDIGVDLNDLKGPVSGLAGGIIGLLPPEASAPLLGKLGELSKLDWSLPIQERSFGTVGASLTMPIYTGGKINAANNAARIKFDESKVQGESSQGTLVCELAERYYGLAMALAALDVRREVAAAMAHHLDDATKMEQTGVISKAERLYAEVHMAGAEREVFAAEQQVKTISEALVETMGAQGSGMTPSSNMFILKDIEGLDHYIELAMKYNPTLRRVGLKRDLAVEGVRLQRSEFAPQVAAMGTAAIYDYKVSHMIPKWAVGVGVSFKIFDGLSREHKYKAAKTQVKMVESIEDRARAQIVTGIEKLYNQLAVYTVQMPSIESSERFALEYLRVREEGFKEGVNSATEVVDARLNLSKIRIERLQTAYCYDIVLARLLDVCGVATTLTEYANRPSAQIITVK